MTALLTPDILHRCTVVYGTPTMHIAMMNVPGFESYDLSSLRLACTAGAICPEELIKEMKTKYTVDTVGVMKDFCFRCHALSGKLYRHFLHS